MNKKYVEIIKWNWRGEKGGEETTTTFFQSKVKALVEYKRDTKDLKDTGAEVYLCEVLEYGK